MHNLVRLTGSFSIDTLKRIVSQVEVLTNQPLLGVDKIFVDKDPQFKYRYISVDDISGLRYHVVDMGRVRDAPDEVPLASRFYSEEEVKKILS